MSNCLGQIFERVTTDDEWSKAAGKKSTLLSAQLAIDAIKCKEDNNSQITKLKEF